MTEQARWHFSRRKNSEQQPSHTGPASVAASVMLQTRLPACNTHMMQACVDAYLQCVRVALWVDARVVQRLKVQIGGTCRGKE